MNRFISTMILVFQSALVFQLHHRAKSVLIVKDLAMNALNCQISVPRALKAYTYTRIYVCRNVHGKPIEKAISWSAKELHL